MKKVPGLVVPTSRSGFCLATKLLGTEVRADILNYSRFNEAWITVLWGPQRPNGYATDDIGSRCGTSCYYYYDYYYYYCAQSCL